MNAAIASEIPYVDGDKSPPTTDVPTGHFRRGHERESFYAFWDDQTRLRVP